MLTYGHRTHLKMVPEFQSVALCLKKKSFKKIILNKFEHAAFRISHYVGFLCDFYVVKLRKVAKYWLLVKVIYEISSS